MIRPNENGFTLVELLVALTILGLISVAVTAFLSSAIQVQASGSKKSALYREGLLAMDRMTSGVRRCTLLLIPSNHTPIRDILAFSGVINDDDDYYFNDPLFPRIDEDIAADSDFNNFAGIAGLDDDGDSLIDEGGVSDDDEDGVDDEDIGDGIDNDGDGNIDEDAPGDTNNDFKAGIWGMDDDGDGQVDEGNKVDDDEDGVNNEDCFNVVIYSYDNATKTLIESIPFTGESANLSTRITFFQVTYEAPDATHGPRIQIALTLTGEDGESVQFVEYAYPRNVLQKTGKRVR